MLVGHALVIACAIWLALHSVAALARMARSALTGRRVRRRRRTVATAYLMGAFATTMFVTTVLGVDLSPPETETTVSERVEELRQQFPGMAARVDDATLENVAQASAFAVANRLAALLELYTVTGLPVFAVGALVVRLTRARRGYADAAVGIACTMVLLTLMHLVSGADIRNADYLPWRLVVILVHILGGALGGFVYWRARGYPGLQDEGRGRIGALSDAIHAMDQSQQAGATAPVMSQRLAEDRRTRTGGFWQDSAESIR